ncbi:glutamyl-tRNA(Gln) amidotransferase subunit C, chloroplastic/mitochondrial [Selaginella moellendorffii]|nr:glutamyl-tRNA(Gln) amidotransferase subunit C, chloroplastic/mitochondrial [Selaginella moellendorffii]|eukprot:XP_002976580.2 glutamyl-tRNA(Gln) amidotransferase subunit C, chloroplastic/mitochondrial [Selaginella moellendorffii]
MASSTTSFTWGGSFVRIGARKSRRGVLGCVKPPNVGELCEKARLSLTPDEAAEIGPQISRVVDWFGQLQEVELDNVDPAIRVGHEVESQRGLRRDEHLDFTEKDSMVASVGEKEGVFIKVPKILNEQSD